MALAVIRPHWTFTMDDLFEADANLGTFQCIGV